MKQALFLLYLRDKDFQTEEGQLTCATSRLSKYQDQNLGLELLDTHASPFMAALYCSLWTLPLIFLHSLWEVQLPVCRTGRQDAKMDVGGLILCNLPPIEWSGMGTGKPHTCKGWRMHNSASSWTNLFTPLNVRFPGLPGWTSSYTECLEWFWGSPKRVPLWKPLAKYKHIQL